MKYLNTIWIILILCACNSEKKLRQEIESININNRTEKYNLGIAGIRYISQYGNDREYSKELIRKLLAAGFSDECIFASGLLLKKFPRDAGLYFLRGSGYRNLHQYREALEDISKAIRIQPGYNQYVSALQSLMTEKKLWDEILLTNESLANSPDSFNLLLYRAEKLFTLREYDAVLYDLGSVSKLGTREDSIYFARQVSSLNREKGGKPVEMLSGMLKYYRSVKAR